MQGLHRNFFYLNLNTRQSVLFFSDVYCDYQLVAKHLYDILKQNYSASFHLAVSSRFEGHEALPEIMSQLEQTMEEKFYHPDVHVFNNEASDSQPGECGDTGFPSDGEDFRRHFPQRCGAAEEAF